jgi:hypothetical protein
MVGDITGVVDIVTAPVAPDIATPVPATMEVTPVLLTDTSPVGLLTDIPAPLAASDVTPVFAIVWLVFRTLGVTETPAPATRLALKAVASPATTALIPHPFAVVIV